jgi:16S rRNA processing protein RimM
MVGRVGRAHALKGDVVVSLVSNRTERTEPGARFWAGDRELVVRRARPDKDRWIMGFEGVSTRDEAEGLRGAELTAPPLADEGDEDVLWVDDLIGLGLEDGGIGRGRVTAVQQNPASDLLVLDSGVLVPSRFVVEVVDGVVVTECPDGLFELT